jgi:aldehyde:ferredoxin oxidoreductase
VKSIMKSDTRQKNTSLPGSYAGGLLLVDLEDGPLRSGRGDRRDPEPPPGSWLTDYVGGRGWGIRWLTDLCPPGTDPLAPANPLLFLTGPLGATSARGFSRSIVMTRSPLTGALARSSCGGDLAAALKFAGVDALALTGAAPDPSVLVLDARDGPLRVILKPAGALWGMDTQETQAALQAEYGRQACVACIGPAGENLVRFAAIVHGTRTASRCGVGTVMGSKRLKAIVVLPPRKRLVAAEPLVFDELVKDHLKRLTAHPRFRNMRSAGTVAMVEKVHQLGMLPVKNFQCGSMEGLEAVYVGGFADMKTGNHACWGCATRCGQVHHVRFGPFAGAWSEGPEYESLWALGPQLGHVDPGAIVAADHLCDRLGLDTISAGVAIGFLFELVQRGILEPDAAGGIPLSWGHSESILQLLEMTAHRQGVGDLLAEGTRRAAETIGQGADHYAIHAKGLELPAYEPRGAKAHGMAYALSNIGGSHMYGYSRQEISASPEPRPVDPAADTGKGDIIAWNQIRKAVEETLILCNFADTAMDQTFLAQTLAAATGMAELGDLEHLQAVGERIVTLERLFNLREGFGREDDRLPARMTTEPLVDAGPRTGDLIRQPEMIVDEYYQHLGYDERGVPRPETLARLKLDQVVSQHQRPL